MLKVSLNASSQYHSFKCGDVFCIEPTAYSVQCCLCGIKIEFNDFPQHFLNNHLDVVKEENKLVPLEISTLQTLEEHNYTDEIDWLQCEEDIEVGCVFLQIMSVSLLDILITFIYVDLASAS